MATEECDTAEEVKIAEALLDDPFLIMNGRTILGQSMLVAGLGAGV